MVGFVNTWVHGQSTENNIYSKLGRNALSSISVKCGNTTKIPENRDEIVGVSID